MEDAAVPVPEGLSGTAAQAIVREQFDNTLAFIPHIYPDNGGNVEFHIDVTDKLSTYYVSVFAHDRRMRNSVLRKEMTVSHSFMQATLTVCVHLYRILLTAPCPGICCYMYTGQQIICTQIR